MDGQKLKKQCTMAFGYSGARLALNYYMFEDGLFDAENLPAVFYSCADSWRIYLEAYLSGTLPVAETEELRRRTIHEMEIVTAYTDCFQIYEYVLNRMERKFETGLPAIIEGEIAEELMGFVVNTRDSVVMNNRIRQIIAQLPVRFTRKKFYGMVREALSIYTGSDKESLDNLMYMLKTSSMTALPSDMKDGYEDLFEILEQLRTMDFKALNKDSYREAQLKLSYVSGRLNLLAGWYLTFQEMINDFYVLLLTKDRAVADIGEADTVTAILNELLIKAKSRDFPPNAGEGDFPYKHMIEDELMAFLTGLEGMQESYYEKYQRVAPSKEDLESGDTEEVRIGRKIDLLLSGSTFVSVEESPIDRVSISHKYSAEEENSPHRPSAENEVVDTAWLDKTSETFFQELDELFAGSQKPVVRAIMAKVLSELPVCFNQIDEIENYIKGSLGSCADSDEKETCIELLRQLMESENALV